MTLRIGVPLATEVPVMGELARRAESAGCDSVWTPEHLVWPAEHRSPYPYSADGSVPVPPTTPTYDAWVLLAWIAAQTEQIRLGTSVYILPLRDPHVTARAVATADVVSGGRVILGAGVGWLAEEFEIAGQEFRTRGRRAAEIATILRRLWSSEDPVGHRGRDYAFPPVHFLPKPVQGRGLPIVFGGESPAALRRAARYGDGWIGLRHTPESAARRVEELRSLLAGEGRAADDFEITVGAPHDLSVAGAQAYEAAGVDRVCLRPWRRGEDPAAGIGRLERLIAAIA